MTKINRNAPCPCGSGKKYKKCCLRKDQEAERQTRAELLAPTYPDWEDEVADDDFFPTLLEELEPDAEDEPSLEIEEEPDPIREFWDDFWETWQDASYEQRLDIAETILRERPDEVDGEVAFEMFVDLHGQTAAAGEHDKFDALVDLLRQQAPDAYDHEAHYFLSWQIQNGLETGNRAVVPALFNQLAHIADEIDEYTREMRRLAYYGELDALIAGNRIAWPIIEDSFHIMSWAIYEFADKAASYETFALLAENPALAADDPVLMERIEPFIDPDADSFPLYLDYLTGRKLPQWTIEDFAFAPPSPPHHDYWDDEEDEEEEEEEEEDTAVTHLRWLSFAFVHYLHTIENVSYPKADMARREFFQYFLKRHEGDLDPSEGNWFQPKRRKPQKQKRKKKKGRLPLCPDRQTLDRRMSQMIGFMSSRFHAAGALFEMVPAWLRFLEKYQIIDAAQREQTLLKLKGLDTEWQSVLKSAVTDPLLLENAKQWRENAGLAE